MRDVTSRRSKDKESGVFDFSIQLISADNSSGYRRARTWQFETDERKMRVPRKFVRNHYDLSASQFREI